MNKSGTFETEEERDDVYSKIKNTFDFLASVVNDETRSLVHRIRAAKSQSAIAKSLRFFILDLEKIDELEKRIKRLEKTIGINKENNEQQ